MIGKRGRCACGAYVWLVKGEAGAVIALDPEPVANGCIFVDVRMHGGAVARAVEPDPVVRQHIPHSATCPQGSLL